MPRNMSFSMTTQAVRERRKTVTRRLASTWKTLRVGEVLNAIEKGQGLKKGEKIRVICQIRVTSVSLLPLCAIDQEDVIREGFPAHWSPMRFVHMFTGHHNCEPLTTVRRIEFEYV